MIEFFMSPAGQFTFYVIGSAAAVASTGFLAAILAAGWLLAGRMDNEARVIASVMIAVLSAVLTFGLSGTAFGKLLPLLPNSYVLNASMVTLAVTAIVFVAMFIFAAMNIPTYVELVRKRKGRIGERKVSRRLSRLGFDHVDDIYLDSGRGVVQIDHLVRVGGGLLVVETKNLEGVIHRRPDGNLSYKAEDDKNASDIGNPVQQNERQVSAVRAFASDWPASGTVVFCDLAEFAKGPPTGCVQLKDLGAYLKLIGHAYQDDGTAPARWDVLTARLGALDQTELRSRHVVMLADNAMVRSMPQSIKVCRKCHGTDVTVDFGYNHHWRCLDCGTRTSIHLNPGERIVEEDGNLFKVDAGGKRSRFMGDVPTTPEISTEATDAILPLPYRIAPRMGPPGR